MAAPWADRARAQRALAECHRLLSTNNSLSTRLVAAKKCSVMVGQWSLGEAGLRRVLHAAFPLLREPSADGVQCILLGGDDTHECLPCLALAMLGLPRLRAAPPGSGAPAVAPAPGPLIDVLTPRSSPRPLPQRLPANCCARAPQRALGRSDVWPRGASRRLAQPTRARAKATECPGRAPRATTPAVRQRMRAVPRARRAVATCGAAPRLARSRRWRWRVRGHSGL